ncbi:MAG: DUF5105 domain-containing protein [Lactobacillales bacterium]|nr:DUF5105 domain-containing protein [Lactobacillales bacterium]
MKKIFLGMVAFLCLSLAGCGESSPIEAKEAGSLFVNELVYHTKTKQFDEEFVDGKNLSKAMKTATTAISKNFYKDFSVTGVVIDEETIQNLTKELTTQCENQTKYVTLVSDGSRAKAKKITYQVYGLDYQSLMEKTTKEVMTAVVKDEKLATSREKVVALIEERIRENIKTTLRTAQPLETTLEFSEQKGQWLVAEGQEEKIRNLYLSFMTGQKDQATLNKVMKNIAEKAGEQAQEELNKTTKK